jgi:hypothetical protein
LNESIVAPIVTSDLRNSPLDRRNQVEADQQRQDKGKCARVDVKRYPATSIASLKHSYSPKKADLCFTLRSVDNSLTSVSSQNTMFSGYLERRAGIEPANTGFADLRVCHFATGAFHVMKICASPLAAQAVADAVEKTRECVRNDRHPELNELISEF